MQLRNEKLSAVFLNVLVCKINVRSVYGVIVVTSPQLKTINRYGTCNWSIESTDEQHLLWVTALSRVNNTLHVNVHGANFSNENACQNINGPDNDAKAQQLSYRTCDNTIHLREWGDLTTSWPRANCNRTIRDRVIPPMQCCQSCSTDGDTNTSQYRAV